MVLDVRWNGGIQYVPYLWDLGYHFGGFGALCFSVSVRVSVSVSVVIL